MLLRLIELGRPVDEVIFCDTYKEFPQMYKHVEKIKQYIESLNIKFTTLKSPKSFDEWMFEYEPKRRNPEQFYEKYGEKASGKGWPTPTARWCTGTFKIKIVEKYMKNFSKRTVIHQYIGIAADETKRLDRINAKNGNKIYPLVEWNWTEIDALEYCYAKGYDWDGLYEIFDRVSCWCCPLQSLEELRKLRKHFPELWQELRDMDKRTWQSFRKDFTVEQLEIRFALEEEREQLGLSTHDRDFFNEMKKRFKEEEGS
jgi:3'-phosphoadenosine 5'-phosphosulfate sulfotransferase (PAPS reductase)/FAD synthetase